MCHGTLHTVVNALQHVLPGIAISMSLLIYNVTGYRKPDDRGGGGCYLVEPRIPYGMHISELLFFPLCQLGGQRYRCNTGGLCFSAQVPASCD